MLKQVGLAALTIMVSGCASTYALPTGIPSASLRAGVGNGLSTFYLHESPETFSRLDLYEGHVAQIPAGQRLLLHVYGYTVIGITNVTCENYFSFIPEEGKTYEVAQSITFSDCMVFLEGETKTRPSSFRPEPRP